MGQTELQILIGFIMPFIIQGLKKMSWFPWLTDQSDKVIKVIWAAFIAAGSALAVTFTYDSTLGQLTVVGLTWANVGHGLTAVLVSLISQQASYRLLIKPKEGG